MKTVLLNQVFNRTFVYTAGALYPVNTEENIAPCAPENLDGFCFLVLGRDNYQEVERTYPVIDQADLNAILQNEMSGCWLASKPVIDGTQTKLKLWIPNERANLLIQENRVIWFPETLLLKLGTGDGFFEYTRFGETLFQVNTEQSSVSSMAVGAYKNASYFLLSAGVENVTAPQALDTQSYFSKLRAGLENINSQQAIQILKAQNTFHYLKNLFHWPSAIAGALAALFIITALQLGWQKVRINSLENQAASQNVKTIVSLERRVQYKTDLLLNLSQQDSTPESSYPMWRLLADIMENRITVIEFSMQDGRNLFRLQSDSAIDTLDFVRGLPYITNAEFTNSVQNSRGKERFTIGLDFISESSQ